MSKDQGDEADEMSLVKRFDHVGITVRNLRAVMAFFVALGLEPDGDAQMAEGHWLEDVIGIDGARAEVVTLRAPGDPSGIELSQFHVPTTNHDVHTAAADEPGLRSVALEVHDLDAAVARVHADGYELVRTVANYQDVFRLCYVRGPEQIIVMLAQRLAD